TVQQIIAAPLEVHGVGDKAMRRLRVGELMELVGLNQRLITRHPDQLSGGQRQRVAIARALALHPRFIVLDEAVSALAVSIRAQVLNLLRSLQAQFGLSYLFISHDLAIVRYMAPRLGVMHRGRLVEIGDREGIFRSPQHAYTQSLISAIPESPVQSGPQTV